MNAAVGPREIVELVQRAQLALTYNQQMMADRLGSSLRTVQRWAAGKSFPSVQELRTLAVAVHPHDPDLARRLAAAVHETPESLGLVAPATEAAAPARPAASAAMLVDSVVSAAADVLDVSPRAARPALLAALERAKLAGLGLDELLETLRPREKAGRASRGGRGAPGKGLPVR